MLFVQFIHTYIRVCVCARARAVNGGEGLVYISFVFFQVIIFKCLQNLAKYVWGLKAPVRLVGRGGRIGGIVYLSFCESLSSDGSKILQKRFGF